MDSTASAGQKAVVVAEMPIGPFLLPIEIGKPM
jgi:hypothetical protein